MARTLSGSNYLKLEASQSPGAVGSIAFRFKPNWNSGDSQNHVLWIYEVASGHYLALRKDTQNILFAGWYRGTYVEEVRQIIVIFDAPSLTPGSPHSALFIDGEEANWVVTWDTAQPLTTLWKNGVRIAGNGWEGTFEKEPFEPETFTSLTIGNLLAGGQSANGDGCEFARFDYILTPEQMQDMQWAGVAEMSSPPVHWVKISGSASPEPAEVGSNLTLVGSPNAATHPTFQEPPPLEFDKPAEGTPINLSHPLADGLLVAWAFNEGDGAPVELVGNDAPSADNGIGKEWEEDGSYHQTHNAILYPSDSFDGLSSFTVCALMTIDVGTFGMPFPFPNFLSGFFMKGVTNPYTGAEPAKSAFFFGYQHADEVDGSAGGRDELWAIIGPLDNWYLFRVSGIPWDTRFQQVFFVYDKDATPKWTCRINGIKHSTCDMYYDSSEVVPVTDSTLAIGAGNIGPDEVHRGSWQYLYAWEGARYDLWEPLLTEPYAFFEAPTDNKTIGGLPVASVKTINSLPIASRKTWGGLE